MILYTFLTLVISSSIYVLYTGHLQFYIRSLHWSPPVLYTLFTLVTSSSLHVLHTGHLQFFTRHLQFFTLVTSSSLHVLHTGHLQFYIRSLHWSPPVLYTLFSLVTSSSLHVLHTGHLQFYIRSLHYSAFNTILISSPPTSDILIAVLLDVLYFTDHLSVKLLAIKHYYYYRPHPTAIVTFKISIVSFVSTKMLRVPT